MSEQRKEDQPMNITYRFEREFPKLKMPLAGELWVWEIEESARLSAVDRFVGFYDGENVVTTWRCFEPDLVKPLHPYIDPSNPPTADTVPEGEAFISELGVSHRSSGDIRSGVLSREASKYHVYARPNAAKLLISYSPKTLDGLGGGQYGMLDGLPSDNTDRPCDLDTDEHGPIYGRLVRVEEVNP